MCINWLCFGTNCANWIALAYIPLWQPDSEISNNLKANNLLFRHFFTLPPCVFFFLNPAQCHTYPPSEMEAVQVLGKILFTLNSKSKEQGRVHIVIIQTVPLYSFMWELNIAGHWPRPSLLVSHMGIFECSFPSVLGEFTSTNRKFVHFESKVDLFRHELWMSVPCWFHSPTDLFCKVYYMTSKKLKVLNHLGFIRFHY